MTARTRSAPSRPAARPARTIVVPIVVAVVTAVAGLVIALLAGGAVVEKIIPGLPDAGTLTRWALPFAKLVMDLASMLTVGALVVAVTLLPSKKGALGASAQTYLRAVSWFAAAWAVAAAVTLVFAVSDIVGLPVRQILGNELTSYAGSVDQGVALMLVILLTTAVALFARTTTSLNAAGGLLALAVVAVLPVPLTGHSATSPNHEVAVTSLALHVVGVTLWVGALAALLPYALRHGQDTTAAANRFSRMAVWCYLAVGLSGVANAATRLTSVSDLWATRYGMLILAKAVAFALLGYIGWLHRERTLPALAAKGDDARRGLFTRLAAVEVAIMTATIGIAVALAQTAPPPVTSTGDAVRDLLGYSLPPPVTLGRLVTLWRPDLFFGVLIVVLGGLYAAGVVRLRRRGDTWSLGRTLAWFAGLVVIAASTLTGVATYAPVLFSVHMGQHMAINMLAPIFLVLGAPVTLALRALHPAARRGDRGPREWLVAILHSPVLKFLTHPLIATVIFMGSTYVLYFTNLFETLMSDHLGHLLMTIHFLASGSLFFWLLLGVDPAPRKLPHLLRLFIFFVTMPFHAFFGIALMSMRTAVASGWYLSLHRDWGASLVTDQHTGGAIAWAFGDIPTLLVMIAIAFQWANDDDRKARRRERHEDRTGGNELNKYNDYLASLDKHG
ncbi:MAG TPA: bifunctional copper resistance protein CopD/cytochrome c oxidase assembly protein [Streptosporangiaceae bacterium]|jgi:putative copper resistance protein D